LQTILQVKSFAIVLEFLTISVCNVYRLFYCYLPQILHWPLEIRTIRAKTKPSEGEFLISVYKTQTSCMNSFFVLYICTEIIIPASCDQTSVRVLPNVSDRRSLHWIHLQHVLQKTNYRRIQVLRGIKDTITYLLKKGWHVIIIKWKCSTE